MTERKGTKALEIWCRRLVKDCPNSNVQIENMTTSWRNGLAFCALIHHFRPDLIDISSLKPENVYENNKLAFSLAEKHLGIPSLLDPEDMVANEVPDRLSILTYLSQFYQRLGHTVQKVSETDLKPVSPTVNKTSPMKFGKTNLEKCASCNLPVYLAQRLLVSQKLYHRRCFRCTKCSGLLNPKHFDGIQSSDFLCDSCKNEKRLPSMFNNNDQMGMLAFDDLSSDKTDSHQSEPTKTNRSSVLEKIYIFEKKIDPCIDQLNKVTITNDSVTTDLDLRAPDDTGVPSNNLNTTEDIVDLAEEITYKSDINKFNFLKTQLLEDVSAKHTKSNLKENTEPKLEISDCESHKSETKISNLSVTESTSKYKIESNVTDDIRLAKSQLNTSTKSDAIIKNENKSKNITENELGTIIATNELEINTIKNELVTNIVKADNEQLTTSNNDDKGTISVPPRKKKSLSKLNPGEEAKPEKTTKKAESSVENYPDHLNPFSDDEEENEEHKEANTKVSTNPFGSSDDDDDAVQNPTLEKPKDSNTHATPTKRLISANPFWSDDEEPSSDEDAGASSSNMYKSQITTSNPNLLSGTPHRKKGRAPPPPVITEDSQMGNTTTSMDDVASISSYSSYNSTAYSDQKSIGKITPRMNKSKLSPKLDSVSTKSGAGSTDHGVDSIGLRTITPDGGGRRKGPAPGLPLPERREVKLQMSPQELQTQLDLLETQQLGLERQGVLIEQMIRDKCEGEEASTVPQEEVEDLVIQLCELVNEKNDLFRKQTELMYIRRQQRLEQEQADIEHEIRIIQSRPAVNRIDADKAREEQLVWRLVQIVRLRDELVQQMEAERRRERQEDHAIAASIASKRAQRNSDAKSSSLKSVDASTATATPKKSKVKDKVKKQFKKAKHSLIHKKKDDSKESKEDSHKKAK